MNAYFQPSAGNNGMYSLNITMRVLRSWGAAIKKDFDTKNILPSMKSNELVLTLTSNVESLRKVRIKRSK